MASYWVLLSAYLFLEFCEMGLFELDHRLEPLEIAQLASCQEAREDLMDFFLDDLASLLEF